eukprot:m.306947 g.306947  ORF g.306947 m.306947 type:complete len:1444 (-) comp15929_c0_seq1:219-4550(-)
MWPLRKTSKVSPTPEGFKDEGTATSRTKVLRLQEDGEEQDGNEQRLPTSAAALSVSRASPTMQRTPTSSTRADTPLKDVVCNGLELEDLSMEQNEDAVVLLKEHTGPVFCTATSDMMAATGSIDTTVRIWNLAQRACVGTLRGHSSAVHCVLFADPDLVVSGSKDKTIRIWGKDTCDQRALLEGHTDSVSCLALRGNTLASGSDDKSIRLWTLDTVSCTATLTGHEMQVSGVALTDTQVISCSDDRTIRIWDRHKGVCLDQIKHTTRIRAMVVDQGIVVTGDTHGILTWWDLDTRQLLFKTGDHSQAVLALTLHGSTIASAGKDGHIRLFDKLTRECVGVLEHHRGTVHALASTQKYIVSGGEDTALHISNTRPRHGVTSMHCHGDRIAAMAANKSYVFSASLDSTVCVWSATGDGSCVAVLTGHTHAVTCIAPHDTLLFSGSTDETVRVWDLTTFTSCAVLHQHTDAVTALAVCADSKVLVSGSRDKTTRVWDIASLTCTAVFSHSTRVVALAAHKQDVYVLLAGAALNNVVHVWNRQKAACTMSFEAHPQEITCLITSNTHLITGSTDKTIRLWDLDELVCTVLLEGHTAKVECLAVEGEYVVSGSADKSIRIFNTTTVECIAVFRGHTHSVVALALQSNAIWSGSTLFDPVVRAWNISGFAWASRQTLPCLPAYAVESTAQEDRQHVDPAMRLGLLRTTLYDYPYTLYSDMPRMGCSVLAWAASASDRIDILEIMLNVPLPSLTGALAAEVLNASIVKAKDKDVVSLVLSGIARAARAKDTIIQSPADRTEWVLSVETLGEAFTRECIRLIQTYPTLAADFLTDLGLVRVATDGDFDNQAALRATGVVVLGDVQCERSLLWHDAFDKGAVRAGSSKDTILTEARVVPLFNAGGFVNTPVKKCSSVLQALVEKEDPHLFANFIVRAIVKHKWHSFGMRSFLASTLWYIFQLILLTLQSFLIDWAQLGTPDYALRTAASVTPRHIANIVMTLLLVLCSLVDFYAETRELLAFGFKHYRVEFWNWVDWIHILLTLAFASTYLSNTVAAQPILAVALYFRWFGVLYYLQPFSNTGPLVRMILAILVDMRFFLLILSVSIVAAYTSFRLLLLQRTSTTTMPSTTDVLVDPANGLLLMFDMLVLSNGDLDAFTGPYKPLARLLFVLSMVVVPVVLLNLLIALMSDSYERIQDRADIEFQHLRARMVYKEERFMTNQQKQDPKLFPQWLHALVPKGSGVGHVSEFQWQGVLNALKSRIRSLSHKTDTSRVVLAQQLNSIAQDVATLSDGLSQTKDDMQIMKDMMRDMLDHCIQLQAPASTPAPRVSQALHPPLQSLHASEQRSAVDLHKLEPLRSGDVSRSRGSRGDSVGPAFIHTDAAAPAATRGGSDRTLSDERLQPLQTRPAYAKPTFSRTARTKASLRNTSRASALGVFSLRRPFNSTASSRS